MFSGFPQAFLYRLFPEIRRAYLAIYDPLLFFLLFMFCVLVVRDFRVFFRMEGTFEPAFGWLCLFP